MPAHPDKKRHDTGLTVQSTRHKHCRQNASSEPRCVQDLFTRPVPAACCTPEHLQGLCRSCPGLAGTMFRQEPQKKRRKRSAPGRLFLSCRLLSVCKSVVQATEQAPCRAVSCFCRSVRCRRSIPDASSAPSAPVPCPRVLSGARPEQPTHTPNLCLNVSSLGCRMHLRQRRPARSRDGHNRHAASAVQGRPPPAPQPFCSSA